MPNVIDVTGQSFGKLTVLYRHPENAGDGKAQWLCLCSCPAGNRVVVRGKDLRSGNTQSCGCHRLERTKTTNTRHGMCNTVEYRIWKAMKERCAYVKHISYSDYGGRGIAVCDEWKESFDAFYRDMGPRPSKHHSIERRETDKGYSKENCYWATRTEQNNNTRRNIFYTRKGVAKTLAAWCKELDLSYNTVYARMNQHGWSFEKAIGDEQ